MKRCALIRKKISPYLDGSLSRRSRTGVERHLRECDDCRREYEEQKQLKRLLREEIRREADPLLTWENLRPALEREADEEARESRIARLARKARTSLETALLPKGSVAFAEAAYWGKRAAIPAAVILLALVLYHSPQTARTPVTGTGSARVPADLVIRVNFGPESAAVPDEYYADTGKPIPARGVRQDGHCYGWRQG